MTGEGAAAPGRFGRRPGLVGGAVHSRLPHRPRRDVPGHDRAAAEVDGRRRASR